MIKYFRIGTFADFTVTLLSTAYDHIYIATYHVLPVQMHVQCTTYFFAYAVNTTHVIVKLHLFALV